MRGHRFRVQEDNMPLLHNIKISAPPASKQESAATASTLVSSNEVTGTFDCIRLILLYDVLMFCRPRGLFNNNGFYHRTRWWSFSYSPKLVRDIDFVCFFLSVVSLAAAWSASWDSWPWCTKGVCGKTSPLDYFVPLQDDNTIFFRQKLLPNTTSFIDTVNNNLSASTSQMKTTVNEFCNQSTTVTIGTITRVWNDITYEGFHIQQPASSYFSTYGISHWMPPGYHPWLILMVIFVVSALFQLFRWSHNNLRNNTRRFGFPEILIKYIFFQGTPCKRSALYTQYRPDFWRWVEYALTSPFQILLIANSVMITDRAKLLGLMAAQAALVLLGFVNEMFTDKVFKKMVKTWKQLQSEQVDIDDVWPLNAGNLFLKLRITLIISWFVFVCIWWAILSSFERQERNTYTCNYPQRMPQAIWFIVGTQLGFFSLFGIVQTVQYFQLTYFDMDMKQYWQALQVRDETQAPLANPLYFNQSTLQLLNRQEKISYDTEEDRKKAPNRDRDGMAPIPSAQAKQSLADYYTLKRSQSWQNVALAYSMLSVIAKTTLEFGFIWLVYFGSFADVPTR